MGNHVAGNEPVSATFAISAIVLPSYFTVNSLVATVNSTVHLLVLVVPSDAGSVYRPIVNDYIAGYLILVLSTVTVFTAPSPSGMEIALPAPAPSER